MVKFSFLHSLANTVFRLCVGYVVLVSVSHLTVGLE